MTPVLQVGAVWPAAQQADTAWAFLLRVMLAAIAGVSAMALTAALLAGVLRFGYLAYTGEDFVGSLVCFVLCGVLLLILAGLLLNYRAGQELGVG